jgi:alpha-N-arabinofuranosidase
VEWQDGWPVFAPGVGRVRAEERSPELPAVEWGAGDEAPDEFDAPVLDGRWCFLRTPREEFHSLAERPGWLRLAARPERLGEPVTPSLVLCRQRHPQAEATAVVEVAGEAVAALVALRDERHHYRLELGGGEARVVRVEAGEERVLGRGAAPEGPCELRLRCEDGRYRFALRAADEEWVELADGDARLLSWEVAGGFTGTMLGLYATGGTGHLDVDRFEQREIVSRR